jgi:hypothetical protein
MTITTMEMMSLSPDRGGTSGPAAGEETKNDNITTPRATTLMVHLHPSQPDLTRWK